MKFRPTLLSGILLSSIALGALTGCDKEPGVKSAEAKAEAAQAVSVQTALVEEKPMVSTLHVTGTLEGVREATVASETNGQITSIVRTIGDRVGAGQPVIKIDDELKAINVKQAEAQRLAAEANLEKAKLDHERNEQLFKQTAITKNQLELSGLQVKSAEAQLKGAQSAESLAKRQLADATIKAPFAGTISTRLVSQGEMVNPGARVFSIVDDSKLKLRINVSEMDVTSIKPGDPVDVKVDAVSSTPLQGRIAGISSKADQARNYQVEVEIANQGARLKSGMFARAEIARDAERKVPTIPNNALITSGSRNQVYVVNGDVANLRGVKVGAMTKETIEIIEGVNVGDEVVTFGQNQLHDGAKVRK